jgi:hypothetical protein
MCSCCQSFFSRGVYVVKLFVYRGVHVVEFFFSRGVHLKDLILLHTAVPDKIEGKLINFRKMAQLSQTLRELTKLQNQDSIPVCANMDLVNTLRVSISMIYAISTVPGTLYGCHRDLVNRYRISVSQIRKYEIFSIYFNLHSLYYLKLGLSNELFMAAICLLEILQWVGHIFV